MAKKMQSVSDDPQAEHYAEICALNVEVLAAEAAWERSKAETKDAKDLFDHLVLNLRHMIGGGPDWQKKLEFGEED